MAHYHGQGPVIESVLKNILAFDCSGASCSTAVLVNGDIRASRFQRMDRGQAEALLPQIRDALREAGVGIKQIDVLATTIGPGSFTGLRIGLAAAKGLSLAAAKPIMSFSSFEAFIAALPPDAAYCQTLVAIDSKRGPAFVQLFDGENQPAGAPVALDQSQLEDFLPPGPTRIIGDAATLFAALTRADLQILPEHDRIAATAIARNAAILGHGGLDRLAVTPLYLRAPDVTMPKDKGR